MRRVVPVAIAVSGLLLGSVTPALAAPSAPPVTIPSPVPGQAVCTVDEVYGLHRFDFLDVKTVPMTVAKSASKYSKALLTWQGHWVGLLDDEQLFPTLQRSLS